MATLFTKIINGELKGTFLYQDDQCVALQDIQPQAPHHFLVIPRQEIPALSEATAKDSALLGHLLWVAAEVARKQGFSANGYRVVINDGRDGGQAVPHLHVHVLAGRALQWPPG